MTLGKTAKALEIRNPNQLEKKLDLIVLLFKELKLFPWKHFLAF